MLPDGTEVKLIPAVSGSSPPSDWSGQQLTFAVLGGVGRTASLTGVFF
ncbi:hypothetical protein K701_26525 [Streptomyces fradiae ATCC 10745 = DSM 40063]|uniref:Uncharacterized protein n=1 Tax=Streptomyces fradiae ATCC 10745 = DSM 40063 TaxID=1319510 RepID=A0A1Y2NQ81_STRFR|nr:hypothetical protein K701_26525 [Streptomyces fradiae ATCC 10745 = DSM 40063]OSY49653.1 hypothetical protein BG846_04793 [Streptomyces fradiae ATCC 10745 = DSM 40063]OSY51098.1 hypothetical protein BG846_03196 [Streptomyces fradiae ATCC 10745 = DSM 40063]OSY51196.1 hypothetical protein BG846_03178 [Streptomyces fradiae ATCC 10745 = DSM 40063]